jgi:50S ribosomal subunit-associated GTPase HflX
MKALTAIPYLEERIVLPDKGIALISAAKGWGMDELLDKIARHVVEGTKHINYHNYSFPHNSV